MPTTLDFQRQLKGLLDQASQDGLPFIELEARQLHRLVGDYPNGGNHRMPICCKVMRSAMRREDTIIHQPPKRDGASLTIKYMLPRTQ